MGDGDELTVDLLERWYASGAMWRVIARAPDGEVTVALLRCDGGEEVQRLVSVDPTVLAYIGSRNDSDE
jgi:hypothetical protein